MNEVFRLEKINKATGKANAWNINLNLFEGEIQVLILRSGTLINTLISIITGEMQPDSGTIYLQDAQVRLNSTDEALKHGIYCIHKSSQLIEQMNIMDNLFLNRKTDFLRGLSRDREFALKTQMLLDKYGIRKITPNTKAKELPFAMRHVIECLKAVSSNAKILIVDEVTSRYTPFELQRIQKLLQELTRDGMSVLMFSNSYSDMISIADRVAVIRNGTVCANLYRPNITKERVITALAGSPVARTSGHLFDDEDDRNTSHSYVLCAHALSNHAELKNINLRIPKGLVYGILDTSADQWKQLIDILTAGSSYAGELLVHGKPYYIKDYISAVAQGIGLINANVENNLCFSNLNLIDNITVMMPNIKKGLIESRRIRQFVVAEILHNLGSDHLLQEYPNHQKLKQMSRKAQMEMAIARLLCAKARLIILVNPSMYYDDVNMPELKKLILHACKTGVTFLIVSSNIMHLSFLCDKISILDDGVILHPEEP